MRGIVTVRGRNRAAAPSTIATPPPKLVAMPRRRIHADYVVIAALICTAYGLAHHVAGEPLHQVPAGHGTVLAALIGPAPIGEITPDPPPDVPPPTAKPLVPSVAAPPPRPSQPLSPPQPRGPAPGEEGPAPGQEGPAPGQGTPPPPAPPPPRGHVQLAP